MRSLTIALALGLGTFASVATAQVPQKLPPTVTVDTVNAVRVQNNRKVPVSVYLEHGKFDHRLGIVAAGKTETLRLPAGAFEGLRSVRLFVHPEGEPVDLASHEFALPKAAELTLIVPAFGDQPSPSDTMMQVITPEELAEATLTVDNPRDVMVTVFTRSGNFDARVGQVAARSRATLRFPKHVIGRENRITLFVHPEGSRDLASETLSIKQGQHLGLRVPPR